jgi:putative methyltransferase (TIGR04325 family)
MLQSRAFGDRMLRGLFSRFYQREQFKPILHRAATLLSPYVPPILRQSVSGLVTQGAYTGDFSSWSDAEKSAEGYASQAIHEKVRTSLLRVKNGEARGERDSVTFDEVPYSYPVVAALLRSAIENDGNLHVVDFGGSLGSSYYQFIAFAPSLRRLEWSIVEQPHFVASGRKDFEDKRLKFYTSIGEALHRGPAQVLLLSSVLTYLPEPYSLILEAMSFGFQTIVVDRTLFRESANDRLCVQRVPEHIYSASYPAWLFSRAKFLATLDRGYELLGEFQAEQTQDFERVGSRCLGFIFERRDAKLSADPNGDRKPAVD